MEKEKSATFQVRVDAARAERFAALAKAMDMTQAQLLRQAVDELLANAESNIDALRDLIEERVRAELSAHEGRLNVD